LPSADFSIIPHLPELYAHCKATEDKDMNIADFITDHLMNIDGMFDAHDNGDEQKPHEPFNHQINYSFAFLIFHPLTELSQPKETIQERIVLPTKTYHFDFIGNIFRPPMS
jgi:hypothetical protein